MASQPIYQFYAELMDYKPKMWRRFQIMNNIPMSKLGYILMTMFEMQASHLFCFDYPYMEHLKKDLLKRHSREDVDMMLSSSDLRSALRKNWHIEIPYEDTLDGFDDDNQEFYDATETMVKRIINKPQEYLTFSYDYGDGWEIELILEEIIIDKDFPGKKLPRVLEGAGYGIIEDCGGTGGLEELSKVFKKKSGTRYKELSSWLGTDTLDLSSFDIDDMNFRLKKVPRIYADLYEYGLQPTKQSLNLLERRYLKK